MFLNHFISVIKEKYSSMNTHVFGYFSIQTFFQGVLLNHKDTFNKLGYKAKINTHTTSYIN